MKTLLSLLVCSILLLSAAFAQAQPKPHFNHTTIYVTDLARASAFYSQVMLLDSISEPFHDHHHTWYNLQNHNELHVVSGATADIPHDINIHLAFAVADLPAFMKHLDDLHIKYGNWKGDFQKIQMRPDNISQIYFQDPDGFWIEVNDDKF